MGWANKWPSNGDISTYIPRLTPFIYVLGMMLQSNAQCILIPDCCDEHTLRIKINLVTVII